jgi:hypothetical protein
LQTGLKEKRRGSISSLHLSSALKHADYTPGGETSGPKIEASGAIRREAGVSTPAKLRPPLAKNHRAPLESGSMVALDG